MTAIIVGVDASEQSKDAVAFARELRDASGAHVTLACVYPPSHGAPARGIPEDVRATLEALRAAFGSDVDRRAIADTSPERALHELAESERAALLVVGSSHRGPLGQVLVGSTAMRLIHGAPCGVAVVPRGYHVVGLEPRFDQVGCALDASDEARAALEVAVAAARARGATLRVIRAFDPADYATTAVAYAPAYADARDDLERRAREGLEEVVAGLPEDARAQPVFESGSAADVLVRESGRLDLLFVGSRGHGARQAALTGSVTRRLLQRAECPVVVLPRTAQEHLARTFAPGVDGAVR